MSHSASGPGRITTSRLHYRTAVATTAAHCSAVNIFPAVFTHPAMSTVTIGTTPTAASTILPVSGDNRAVRLLLLLLLGCYVTLGIGYNVAIPPFEAPDEPQHFDYIRHLAEKREIPVLRQGEGPSEAHQPPLYYALAALLAAPGLPVDVTPLLQPNPHWSYDLSKPGEANNANRFSHGSDARWPLGHAAALVHGLRLLSLLCGATAVLMMYRIGRIVVPPYPAIGLGAAAIMAFNPAFLFTSSIINNDSLAICVGTATIWLLASSLRNDQLTGKRAALLGLLLGLGVLSKLSAITLVPVAVLTVLYLGWRSRWQGFWKPALAMVVVAALVAGWWFLRNESLYGDWLGYSRWRAVWDSRPQFASLAELLREVPKLWRTLWLFFGWGNVAADPPVYAGFTVFTLLCLAGWVQAYLRRRAHLNSYQMSRELVVFLVTAVLWGLAATFVFLGVAYFGASARYAFPVLSAFALILFIGLSLWFSPRWLVAVSLATILSGSIVGLMALVGYLIPAYAAPLRLSSYQVPDTITPLNWQVGDDVRLLGYVLSNSRIAPGDVVEVTLYWEPETSVDRDYSIFLHLLGPDSQTWGSVDSFPGMGTYPTRAWRPGEVIVDTYRLQVAPTATVPSAAWLETGMYDFFTGERLAVSDQSGNPIEAPRFVRLALSGSMSSLPDVQQSISADFGDQIRLLGLNRPETTDPDTNWKVTQADELRFTLYWQALSTPTADFSRFAHLVAADGSLISQQDTALGGDYPTGLWQPSDWTEDRVAIPIPDDARPGDYKLIAGLYDPVTQQRLTLPSGADHDVLAIVEVD